MNKRKIMIITGLISLTWVLFYFLTMGKILSIKVPKQAMAQHTAQEHSEQGTTEIQQTKPQPLNEPSGNHQETKEEVPTVEITPEKQQLIGVKIVEASIKPLQKIIRTVGRMEFDERKLFTINIKFEGWIEKLYADYTGRYIRKGEPLADIYSPELYATQQELLNVLRWTSNSKPQTQNSELTGMLSKDAERLADSARQRLKLWDISDEQIEKIQKTGQPIRTFTIYSPVNGYVVEKMAIQGMKVMTGEKLFTIADLSTLWILADIYEYELSLVKPGQKAKITLSYLPDKEFSSTINYVYPSLSGTTRTAKVRFEIPNYNDKLKPRMFTNIEIKIDLGKRLSIPEDAVIDTGTRQIVYVDTGEGNFEPREVMLGLKADGLREVLMGLKPGEKVASSAGFMIDSEAKLKGIKPLEGHKH